MTDCPFCPPEENRVFHDGDLFWCFWSKFEVAQGHALIVPKRHVESFFELTPAERNMAFRLVKTCRKEINEEAKYGSWTKPDAYNVGFNDGEAAGQTVKHFHVHVIPRRRGDVPDPRGGVRNVIPDKGNYLKK